MFLNSERKYQEADYKVTFIDRRVNFHPIELVKLDPNKQFNRFCTEIVIRG